MKNIISVQIKTLNFTFLLVLLLATNVSAQMDTIIIGYQDTATDAQKRIVPDILGFTLMDSITIFNHYKYVMPDTILLDTLQISAALKSALISEFGTNLIFEAEEKKRVAGKTDEDEMAGAEGMGLSFDLRLASPLEGTPSICSDERDSCLPVTSPVNMAVCDISAHMCTTHSTAKVAVMDTGIALHDDFSGQVMEEGYDLVTATNTIPLMSPTEDLSLDGHGTKVAGEIIASSCCSQNVQILSIRILDENGKGSLWNMLKGIAIAIEHEIEILNISAGFTMTSPPVSEGNNYKAPLEKALEIAGNHNMLVVTSAGNATQDNDVVAHYPSNYSYLENVIAVTASCGGALEYYANYGQHTVTLATMGNVVSTTNDDTYYAQAIGTSFAAAAVSGFAALLKINTPASFAYQPTLIKQVMSNNVNGAFPNSTTAGGELMPEVTLIKWQEQFCASQFYEQEETSIDMGISTKTKPLVYPSPFQEVLNVEFNVENNEAVSLTIFNLNQERLYQTQKNVAQGVHVWEVHQLEDYPSGIYIVKLEANQAVFNYKVVKM